MIQFLKLWGTGVVLGSFIFMGLLFLYGIAEYVSGGY